MKNFQCGSEWSCEKMLSDAEHHCFYGDKLKNNISHVLTKMETNVELSETLLCSYLSCFSAVKERYWSSY